MLLTSSNGLSLSKVSERDSTAADPADTIEPWGRSTDPDSRAFRRLRTSGGGAGGDAVGAGGGAGSASVFVLDYPAISSSITCAIGDVAIERSRVQGFYYNVGSNSIVLTGHQFDPLDPAEVTVGYQWWDYFTEL